MFCQGYLLLFASFSTLVLGSLFFILFLVHNPHLMIDGFFVNSPEHLDDEFFAQSFPGGLFDPVFQYFIPAGSLQDRYVVLLFV